MTFQGRDLKKNWDTKFTKLIIQRDMLKEVAAPGFETCAVLQFFR